MVSVHLQAALPQVSLLVIVIQQEKFCVLPRMELCEAKLDETDTERYWGCCELEWLVWHTVANGGSWIVVDKRKLQLTKKEGPPLPRIVVERAPEVDPRRFYVSSADIEAHGHIGIAWKSDKTTQQRMPRTNQNYHWEKLDGKARMNAYKNRFAKTERVKERERARVERGARDVPIKHGNEETMADRHAVDLARTRDNTTRT